jgi:ABC-type sugar transport system, periplasmic component
VGEKLKRKAIVLVVMALFVFSAFAESIEAKKKTISLIYANQWEEIIEPGISNFEKATGIKVDAIKVPPAVSLDEKLALDLAGGVACDVIMVDSYRVPGVR